MELSAIVPELILAGACLLLVALGAFARTRWPLAPSFVLMVALLAASGSTVRMIDWPPQVVFHGTYAVDQLGTVFKLIVLGGAIVALALLGSLQGRMGFAQAPAILAFMALGGLGLASSIDLTLIIIFVQILSVASYVLVALVHDRDEALEAALKYFIYGAAALAVMAYGLTFFYGLTGSLDLRVIGAALDGGPRVWVAFAVALSVAGYGFEIALVPLHFWAPDTLAGAPAPIAGVVSVIPKLGAVAGLVRLLVYLPESTFLPLVGGLAALSMTLGNLVALRQKRLKRLLAYSSIAQAGYVLMAVATIGRVPSALGAVGYYLAAYLFMNLGAFAVVGRLEQDSGSDDISLARGLGYRARLQGLALTICLLSLAGIPPLAGFVGKVLVFEAALSAKMVWLAVVAAINVVIGLAYYVRVLAVIYTPLDEAPRVSRQLRYAIAFGLAVAGTIALGVVPERAVEWMRASANFVR